MSRIIIGRAVRQHIGEHDGIAGRAAKLHVRIRKPGLGAVEIVIEVSDESGGALAQMFELGPELGNAGSMKSA